MTLERIYQLRDEGKISMEEAMRLAEALQQQQAGVQPQPGIISSWVSVIAGGLAVGALAEYHRKFEVLALFGSSPLLRGWLACLLGLAAVVAWYQCRRSAIYNSSTAVRGRAAAGIALGVAVLVIRLPQLLLWLSA